MAGSFSLTIEPAYAEDQKARRVLGHRIIKLKSISNYKGTVTINYECFPPCTPTPDHHEVYLDKNQELGLEVNVGNTVLTLLVATASDGTLTAYDDDQVEV